MFFLKQKLAKNYVNSRGWRTNQKYIVIESDDWGAIRMPSLEVYNTFLDNKVPVNESPIDKLDSLESSDDLKALYYSLGKFTDNKGNHPILTAFHVVANPDFEKIEASNRKDYHFETIFETYKRCKATENVSKLIFEGIEKGIYLPQSHGREHIHVKRWMEAIISDSEKEHLAFKNKAIISTPSKKCNNPYLENYFAGQDYSDESEYKEIEKNIEEGLNIFEDLFGFKSLTFTPQGGFWGDHILKVLSKNGVLLACGQQAAPDFNKSHKVVNKFWGQKNDFGQFYYRRNVLFDPFYNQDLDWVNKALKDIEIAFFWNKPAVISTHRANFTGSIFEENRIKSLDKLELLLSLLLKKWPDVQFISSQRLAEIMKNTIK
jgi:hypothetical protein